MPFCNNCGSQIPEGTKFCPNCGSVANGANAQANNEGSIVIIRKPSSAAKLIKTKVMIDGLEYAELKENEEIEVALPFGSHTLTLKCGMNPALTEIVQIGSTNSVYFAFKISLSGKPTRIMESAASVNPRSSFPEGNKPKKKKKRWGVVVAIFVVIVLIGVISSNGDDTTDTDRTSESVSSSKPISSSKPVETPKPTPTPKPTFAPYTDTVGNWEITVNDFSYKESVSVGLLREYRAEEGSKYCIINLTVKNLGKESATFLPYVVWGDDTVAKIKWKDYEYIRSELLWSHDNLSSETLNPLVSTSGNIAFELPDEVIESDIPPVLVIKSGNKSFTCELVKTTQP